MLGLQIVISLVYDDEVYNYGQGLLTNYQTRSGNRLTPDAYRRPDAWCNRVCMADYRYACGGRNMLSLYEVEESHYPISVA